MRSDTLGALEFGEHWDVEQLSAGSRSEGVHAMTEAALKLLRSHRTAHSPRKTPAPGVLIDSIHFRNDSRFASSILHLRAMHVFLAPEKNEELVTIRPLSASS
jgi:hypothetical protein